MALLNLVVNKLGQANQEYGVTPEKLALLDGARSFLLLATGPALTVGTVTATPVESGGSLVNATYKYKVSAINGNGESVASAASADAVITGTDSNGSVSLSWTAVAGATGYRVYGRTGGLYRFIALVFVASYLELGAIVPDSTSTAPVADTSALSVGAKTLACSALTQTIFAMDCATNNMSGSGRVVTVTSTEKKLNEPYHTAKAFADAMAALSA